MDANDRWCDPGQRETVAWTWDGMVGCGPDGQFDEMPPPGPVVCEGWIRVPALGIDRWTRS